MFLAHTFFPLGFFFIYRMFFFCLKIKKNMCLLPKRFPFHACKNESFLISFILFQTKKKGTEKARGNTFQGFFSCLKQKKKSGFLRKVFSCTNSFSTWFSTHATMFSCIFCPTHGKQTQKPSGKFYKLVFVFMFESEKKYFFRVTRALFFCSQTWFPTWKTKQKIFWTHHLPTENVFFSCVKPVRKCFLWIFTFFFFFFHRWK